MKYEIKFVHPIPVLLNSLRVLAVLGLLMTLMTFFVFPTPSLATATLGQKMLLALVFWAVYTVGFALMGTLTCVIYNFFTRRFKGVTVYLEQSE